MARYIMCCGSCVCLGDQAGQNAQAMYDDLPYVMHDLPAKSPAQLSRMLLIWDEIIHMCIFIQCIYICIHSYYDIYVYTYVSIYLYIYIYICVCVCIYIYIYKLTLC